MSQNKVILERLSNAFGLYIDLIDSLDAVSLESKLPGLPSNTIGQQIWCVVGARESYSKAIQADAWSGFSCSLKQIYDRGQVADALHSSGKTVLERLGEVDHFSENQHDLILRLLEHEAQHHGQLIRYLYALKLPRPVSWKRRYALD